MKAAVYQTYGSPDVVEIRDVPRPDIAEDQVLVQVYASTITTADWRFRASAFPGALWLPGRLVAGLFRPKKPILGMEFAGRVVSVGAKVTDFKLGDDVFGFAGGFGAHAEYIAVNEAGSITHMPDGSITARPPPCRSVRPARWFFSGISPRSSRAARC